jgi:WD40 repeat protein
MRILKGRRPNVCGLAFTPDGQRLFAGTTDGTVTVWDTTCGGERGILTLGARLAYPFYLTLTPDGRTLAAGGQHLPLTFRDTFTGQPVALLPVELRGAFGLAFSPDSRTFTAVPARNEDRLHYLRRWDVGTGRELLPPLLTDGCTIASPAFSPDSKALVVFVYDRTTRLFDLEAGEERACWRAPSEVNGLTRLPDGRTLAVTLSRSVVLWDVQRGKERGRLKGHTRRINGLAVAPDSRLLATASDDGMVRLWDAATWKCRAVLDWGIGAVRAVVFAPDGMTGVAGGERGDIVIWDVDEGGP